MESDRHAFMRKLLQLCVDTNVEVCIDTVIDDNGNDWIESLRVDLEGRTATGYWDGESHRVDL
jgi:hypothetical protein